MKPYKRFLAYIIDIIILGIIFIILKNLLPLNNDVQELNHHLAILGEQLFNKQITMHEYISNFLQTSYQIDYLNTIYSGLSILLICFYFIIIPILSHGRTIGMYITGLKIEGELSVKNLIIRNIIANGILYMIICLILVKILNYKYYFIIISILGFVQFLLVIISIFMIIYRKDKRGLQDIFSKTEIIEEVHK